MTSASITERAHQRRPGLRWRAGTAIATLALLVATPSVVVSADAGNEVRRQAPAAAAPLTNLAHLDWLSVPVDPPTQAGHTTYRLAQEPEIGVLWTYAEPDGAGGFEHVGGGEYDPDTNTWGQGAFNADDVTRAAVVYLRHWKATGSTTSMYKAYQLLRGVTYLQTATGPNRGNVVLWMQPDGTLNHSAEPPELPDPSDSDQSYWLARTIWALGEGYAAFRNQDPAFASFLRDRLDLAIGAVNRQVLDRYGDYLNIDGERTPAWLIVDGADATAEAILGLSAYVDAGGPPAARRALARLSEGVAALSAGNKQSWPFGSIRPWALSRSVWHGWGSQMPAALARASVVLGNDGLARAAARDSFTFDPWLLTSGGPDNGRMPTRADLQQIAYGADSRVQSLIATAEATDRVGGRRLAGIMAAWFFGANPAGEAMYDPATGTTYDGISGDGSINRNSGAESTIHGLLTMIALDGHPGIANLARTASIQSRVGTTTLEAEQGTMSGDAEAVALADRWTGESLFGGTGYASIGPGGSVTMPVSSSQRSLVIPVFELRPGSSAVTRFRADGDFIGRVRSDAIGAQGASPAPGALLPVTLPGAKPTGVTELVASRGDAQLAGRARLDAVMLEPFVSRFVLRGDDHGTALISSASERPRKARVLMAGSGPARIESYDRLGRLLGVTSSRARTVLVTVPAGGFTFVRR